VTHSHKLGKNNVEVVFAKLKLLLRNYCGGT